MTMQGIGCLHMFKSGGMISNKISVCLVTCYTDPNYVRVKTLEAGFMANDGVRLSIVRNRQHGVLRYAEVILKLIRIRLLVNPNIYFLTFRGYEILPFVLLIGIGKKVIFDEFINLIEWIAYEHKKIQPNSIAGRSLFVSYKFLLRKASKIITDTNSHASYSAELMGLPIEKYEAIPVGADERVFKRLKQARGDSNKFIVLYYGSMLPLHGVEHVIEAAIGIDNQNIEFLIIGGNDSVGADIETAVLKGANIKYKKWVPYNDLPRVIASSDVCLGGPFGNTVQSQSVVTGKTIQFLRMGKPVIVGKNKESNIFDDKVNALIVDQADSKSLRDAIVWSYKNQDSLNKIGKNCLKLYDAYFSSNVIKDDITRLLNSI